MFNMQMSLEEMTKYKSDKYYPIFKNIEVQVTDRKGKFARAEVGIEKLLEAGQVLFGDTQYGSGNFDAVENLKSKYEKFSKNEGKELFGKEINYDGYAVLDLDESVYAVHIETNGKTILGVNKNNCSWMDDDIKRLEVFGHEAIHHWNKSEKETDEENYNGFVNLYDKAVGYMKGVYKKVANNIADRLGTVY